MSTPEQLVDRFWKALDSDRTVMLGLVDASDAELRPMTAQIEDGRGPVWFFTAKDTALAQALDGPRRASLAFVSKGHDLFASVEGRLEMDNDRAVIDRLWNRYVAAWYEGGKDDPKLALLRFEPEHGQIWEDGSSLAAGIKLLLGADPKREYRDHVAKVAF